MTNPLFVVFDAVVMLLLVLGTCALWLFVGHEWAVLVPGVLATNHVIGTAVCAWIDDENESLRRWIHAAPSLVLGASAVQAWPLILWLRRRP